MSNKTSNILKNQKLLYKLAIFLTMIVIFVLFYTLTDEPKNKSNIKASEKKINLPSDNLNAQDLWMARIDQENKVLDQKLKFLEQIIQDSKKLELEKEKEKQDLKTNIKKLTLELQETKSKFKEPSNDYLDPFTNVNGIAEPIFQNAPLVQLEICNPLKKLSHVDAAIPAGTTVRALLISSIFAPAGMYAPTNPIPVKLRIMDVGHLPKGVKAKLKGGILIASAYGDLSNERIHVRLERLTQVRKDGYFVETDVAGYVSGEDGGAGIRGVVVDRSGKMVSNAAMSGFLSQLGQILQSGIARHSTYKVENNTLNYDVLKQSAVGGSTNALDMLAEYYLKRAEQIQPVIQVNGGRIVDVTFNIGSEVGDFNSKEKIQAIREEARFQECNTIHTPSEISLTRKPIKEKQKGRI